MVSIAKTGVTSFTLQTTNEEGVKQAESTVSISGEVVTATQTGTLPEVPVTVSKVVTQHAVITDNEAQAKESSATSRLSDVFTALLAGKKVEYPSEFSIDNIINSGFPLKKYPFGMGTGFAGFCNYSKATNTLVFGGYLLNKQNGETLTYNNCFSSNLNRILLQMLMMPILMHLFILMI